MDLNAIDAIALRWAALCILFVTPSVAKGAGDATPPGLRIILPPDASVLDARRDFGAVGDGKADDTQALQRGIDASCGVGGPTRVLYLPNGIYRISQTLVVKSSIGPWLWGETREGVIIRMRDGVTNSAPDCTAVLRTHPSDTKESSADFFMRNIRNLTLDAGDNPGLDGVRFYGNNNSLLKNVRVVGNGRVGINAGFLGQNGPNLIQDATVEGFETGIRSAWSWGGTLSRITIRNCRHDGVYVNATAVGIEDLVVENTPVALRNEYPNDWKHWGGVVALVGGQFSGSDPTKPAIDNTSVLYARNVASKGFLRSIRSSTAGGDVNGLTVNEYLSHPPKHLFDASPSQALQLPIQPEPSVPWEETLDRWVCVNDFGAKPGDNLDDTAAFQAAIDHAAASSKTTVYLRGIGGPDPNWYTLEGEVRIHGSVRHIIGLGFGRVIGGPKGRFLVDDRSAPVVKFQNIQAFGGKPAIVENHSTDRTLVVESCDLKIVGAGKGDIFATDCPSSLDLQSSGQRLWARQLNPEGNSDHGLVQNHGGVLWTLGVKHEGTGVRYRTDHGGKTEILGLFLYGPGNLKTNDLRPIFDVDNASFSAAGVREISFGQTYPVKVREKRGEEERILREDGWIGWTLYSGRGSDRTLFDFESGTLEGWRAEGGEWTNCVVSSEIVGQWREDRRPLGMQGRFMLATGDTRHGQTKDGQLVSGEFEITHDWLKFLLAGEPHPKVRIVLRVADKEARVAYGNNNYDLRWRGWDVREFKGRKARLVIEEFSNAHSLIRVDDFRLSDTPPPPLEDWSEMRRQECDNLRYGEWRLAYEPDFKGFIHHTCFVRGHDGQWHLYGTVTDSIYTFEGVLFHAAAPKLTDRFKTVQAQSLKADPQFGERFVRDPFVLFHEGQYWCFYLGSGEPWKGWDKNNNWQKGDYGPKSVQGPWHLHLATSKDGSTWTRHGKPLFSDTPFLFTPFITRIGDQWVMYYAGTEPADIHTGLHGLIARTSKDLVNWSERRTVFTGFSDVKWPEHSFVHSPLVWQRNNDWYLLCGPIGNANASRFHYRQLYRSKDPLDWGGRRPQEISDLKGLFLEGGSKIYAEDGKEYITHSGPFAGGVWIAPLMWKEGK